jgi:hypothetical protein
LLTSKASTIDPSSLGDRLYQAGRDGAKSSLTLSIFSGEDHTAALDPERTNNPLD